MRGIETVGVCGAGTMGAGIAYAAAAAGYNIVLTDIDEASIRRGQETIERFAAKGVDRGKISADAAEVLRSRITYATDLEAHAAAGIVIEAIVEDLSIKVDLFTRLSSIVDTSAILATNTSSLSVTEIAASLDHPERFVGMHFFNPAHIMKLVEVICGSRTRDETVDRTVELSRDLGKSPVVAKDVPGFIVNRVARNFYGEALKIAGEQGADFGQIDRAMRAIGFRMGPFELMDLIGIDVNFAVTKSVYGQFFDEPRFRPHLIQKSMVDGKQLGKKSGGGFYSGE